VGVSWYRGAYNRYRVEGEEVDEARHVTLVALDLATELGPLSLRGEMAHASIDVPDDLRDLFARRQFGWHLDASLPVWRPRLRGLPEAVVNADVRLEQVDLNRGRFASTGGSIGDETRSLIVPAGIGNAGKAQLPAFTRERPAGQSSHGAAWRLPGGVRDVLLSRARTAHTAREQTARR
jgi:hypothetical protein